MKSIVGATVEPIYEDAREGDVRHSQADISKARQALHYEPQTSFDEGLRRTIEWYRGVTPVTLR
jgi:nucleoside-diphosphate-sugar epimerase